MAEYVDMLGQTIREGDFVVYATTSVRSPVLKLARVMRVNTYVKSGRQWDYDKSEYVTHEYQVTKVGVKEIKNGRGFWRSDAYVPGSYEWDMSKVRTTYPMVENIVKVALPEGEE